MEDLFEASARETEKLDMLMAIQEKLLGRDLPASEREVITGRVDKIRRLMQAHSWKHAILIRSKEVAEFALEEADRHVKYE